MTDTDTTTDTPIDARLKKHHIINLQGKRFVLLEGLVDVAHQEGLCRTEVQIIQLPNESNGQTTICHATVETSKGVFQDIGDASPATVNRAIAPHAIRMASTRATARALRLATNITMTAVEELSGSSDVDASPAPEVASRHQSHNAPQAQAQQENVDPNASTPNQQATIIKLSRLLGEDDPGESVRTLTKAEASERITALSRAYNERKPTRMAQ